jgi:diguanylate cyclase (GGDEF)-like protein
MLYLIILALLTVLVQGVVRKVSIKGLISNEDNYKRLGIEYERLKQENSRLQKDNGDLEMAATETIALYDLTKEICKTLDKTKIFSIFKERINKYLRAGDCMLLDVSCDTSQYRDYTILPLMINKSPIGYLAAKDIKEEEMEKFYILAHQFLGGVKRALLYEKVQELSISDSLTLVLNRRYFIEKFNEEIKRSKKFKHSFSLLILDIDNFKGYNDNYGHLVGDAVLRKAAEIIKENIRQIDFIGRLGGDEFAIILTETDKEQAAYAAQRIRRAVESKELKAYDEQLKVTISLGVSTFPQDAAESSALIDKADKALYLAKQAGKNRIHVYEGSG